MQQQRQLPELERDHQPVTGQPVAGAAPNYCGPASPAALYGLCLEAVLGRWWEPAQTVRFAPGLARSVPVPLARGESEMSPLCCTAKDGRTGSCR